MTVSVQEVAKHFGVDRSTVNKWIVEGCPVCELGSVGRGHGSQLDLAQVTRWRVAQLVPTLAQHAEDDVLALVATALWDCLKRDLAGQTWILTTQAERMVLMVYERLYRNVKRQPLEIKAMPEELRRVCANYLSSVELGTF